MMDLFKTGVDGRIEIQEHVLDAVDNPTQLWNLTSQRKLNGSSIREGLELVGWTLRSEMPWNSWDRQGRQQQ